MYLNKYDCVLIKLYVWILTFDIRIILMSYYIFPTHKGIGKIPASYQWLSSLLFLIQMMELELARQGKGEETNLLRKSLVPLYPHTPNSEGPLTTTNVRVPVRNELASLRVDG